MKGKPGPPIQYRPEDYIDSLATWLEQGQTLSDWCRLPGNPGKLTVHRWRQRDPEIEERIARARDIGFDVLAEQCLRIADEEHHTEIVTVDPSGRQTVTRQDATAHRKLRIETRLKLLAKWDPRRYGDKLDLHHGGDLTIVVETGVPRVPAEIEDDGGQ